MMHTRAYKEVCRDEDWTIFRLAPSGLRGWPGYRWAQPRPQYHRRASASNSVFFQNRGVGVVWKERMLAFLRKKRERGKDWLPSIAIRPFGNDFRRHRMLSPFDNRQCLIRSSRMLSKKKNRSSRMIRPSGRFYIGPFNYFGCVAFSPTVTAHGQQPQPHLLPGGGEASARDENFPELSLNVC